MIKKLIGGMAVSMAFTSPVIAQESFTELKNDYVELLNEKVQDGLLTPIEIEEVRNYLEGKLKFAGEKDRSEKSDELFSSKLENLEKLKKFYPGLLDNAANLVYLTDELLIKEHSDMLKESINETSKQDLFYLISKENLSIEDLILAYNSFNVDLKELRAVRSYMEEQGAQKFLNEKLNNLNSYLKHKEDIDESSFNDKRQVGCGVITWAMTNHEYEQFEMHKILIAKNFSDATRSENFVVTTFEETFPDYVLVDTKRKLLGILLSAFLPAALRLLTKTYRKDNFNGNEIGYHVMDGLIEGMTGIDALIHPYVFYARVLGPIAYDVVKGVKK